MLLFPPSYILRDSRLDSLQYPHQLCVNPLLRPRPFLRRHKQAFLPHPAAIHILTVALSPRRCGRDQCPGTHLAGAAHEKETQLDHVVEWERHVSEQLRLAEARVERVEDDMVVARRVHCLGEFPGDEDDEELGRVVAVVEGRLRGFEGVKDSGLVPLREGGLDKDNPFALAKHAIYKHRVTSPCVQKYEHLTPQ